jgi:uncharacterized membrane protein YdjX (TVP38/TMEM64 family)
MKTKKKQIKKETSNEKTLRIVTFAMTVVIIIVVLSQRQYLSSLSRFGYLGIFLVNFVTSATVLFPIPGVASVFIGGAIWNPLLVGVISGIGAALGEATGYLLGYGGRGFLKSLEQHNFFKQIEHYFHKAGFITTFILSISPIPPFDFVGILAGTLNYPIWKFALATFLGRTIRNIIVAWSGAKMLPY